MVQRTTTSKNGATTKEKRYFISSLPLNASEVVLVVRVVGVLSVFVGGWLLFLGWIVVGCWVVVCFVFWVCFVGCF